MSKPMSKTTWALAGCAGPYDHDYGHGGHQHGHGAKHPAQGMPGGHDGASYRPGFHDGQRPLRPHHPNQDGRPDRPHHPDRPALPGHPPYPRDNLGRN